MRGGAAFSRSIAKFVSVNAEFGLEYKRNRQRENMPLFVARVQNDAKKT